LKEGNHGLPVLTTCCALTVVNHSGTVYRQLFCCRFAKFVRRHTRPPSAKAKKQTPTNYVATTKDTAPVAEGVDVGVTFWRLRAARKNDAPSLRETKRKVVRVKNKEVEKTVTLVPMRAESETLFADGDSLRLSIEVPYQAYIYVFNREQYRDGMLGEPYLVYPGTSDVKRSEPGRLVSIPNESDSLEITPSSTSQEKVAEVFVVVVTPQAIKELPPLKDEEENRAVDGQQFERWEKEWGARVWKFERQGGRGASITQVEKSAGKTSGAALTETDPQPQTVYHVARKSTEVLWLSIPIKIRK
jgi:hypothetical protein